MTPHPAISQYQSMCATGRSHNLEDVEKFIRKYHLDKEPTHLSPAEAEDYQQLKTELRENPEILSYLIDYTHHTEKAHSVSLSLMLEVLASLDPENPPEWLSQLILEALLNQRNPQVQAMVKANPTIYTLYLNQQIEQTFLDVDNRGIGEVLIANRYISDKHSIDLRQIILCQLTIGDLAPNYQQIRPQLEAFIFAINRAFAAAEENGDALGDYPEILTHYRGVVETIATDLAKAYLKQKLATQNTRTPAN